MFIPDQRKSFFKSFPSNYGYRLHFHMLNRIEDGVTGSYDDEKVWVAKSHGNSQTLV